MILARLVALSYFAGGWLLAGEVRFLAFDLAVPLGDYRVVPPDGDAAKGTTVEIAANRFSNRLKLGAGSHRLVLPDGTAGPSFAVADDAKRTLLVVLPSARGGVGLTSVPDNADEFGPGERWFLNVTSEEVRVQFGERNLRLLPGSGHSEKAPARLDDGRIAIRMLVQRKERWVPFNSTWWPHDAKVRSIVLIHPNQKTGLPSLKNIAETVEQEKPES